MEPFTLAVIQATPVFLDRERTIEKACKLIEEAGKAGAKLVLFPESFVPAYPDWVWWVPPGEDQLLNTLYAKLLAQSVDVPGPATEKLGRAAKKAGLTVAVGVSERNAEASGATMYNTLVMIGPDGHVLAKHRKLVPTAAERLVWAQGDGSTLQVVDTPVGKVGALICWENYMPLARYAMQAWGAQIHLAPTWDRGETWQATLRHMAKEARVVVASSCIAMRKKDLPDGLGLEKWYADSEAWINVGESAIVGPEGEYLAGPVREKEDILYAQIDPAVMRGPKWMLDVAGHYARPDVFQLTVDRTVKPMVR